MSTVRSVIETLHWFAALNATVAVLMKGIFQNFINTHLPRMTGQAWADGRQVLRVPGGLVSEGWGERPQCLPPLSQEAKREIILTLMATLNEAFELNLCEAPCTARTRSDLASSRRDSGWRKVLQWLQPRQPPAGHAVWERDPSVRHDNTGLEAKPEKHGGAG